MNKKGDILILDDDSDILLTSKIVLKKELNVTTENDPENLIGQLKKKNFDVILLDMNFVPGDTSGREGIELLKKVLQYDSNATVIMITAYGDIDLAVKAIKEGAIDFVVKPWDNKKLLATINAAYHLHNSKKEILQLKQQQSVLNKDLDRNFPEIIGNSESIKSIFKMIDKIANTDANVLITGENGTGKELVAREIHRKSSRSDQIFMSVDLGAIPETLFESELFGHEKGAFTDAKESRTGRFELASGGTLFLDEIGNLSMPLQSKLLSVLQNREVSKVGANKNVSIDIRLVCATNMPLKEMIKQNEFRDDLFYRINTVEIDLPSLCERDSDIPLLTDHFLNIFTKKYNKKNTTITKETLRKLKKYHWPGNVRELGHVIERAVILSEGNKINPEDLAIDKVNRKSNQSGLKLDEIEKQSILAALNTNNYNLSKTAEELGFARSTLYRKMNKYGL